MMAWPCVGGPVYTNPADINPFESAEPCTHAVEAFRHYSADEMRAIGRRCASVPPCHSSLCAMLNYELQRKTEGEKVFVGLWFKMAKDLATGKRLFFGIPGSGPWTIVKHAKSLDGDICIRNRDEKLRELDALLHERDAGLRADFDKNKQKPSSSEATSTTAHNCPTDSHTATSKEHKKSADNSQHPGCSNPDPDPPKRNNDPVPLDYSDQLRILTADLDAADHDIAVLFSERNSLAEKLQTAQLQINNLETEREALTNSLRQCQASMHKLEERQESTAARLDEKLAKGLNNANTQEAHFTKLECTCNDLRVTSNNSIQRLASLESDLSVFSADLALVKKAFNMTCREDSESFKSIRMDNESMARRIEHLERGHQALSNRVDDNDKHLGSLKSAQRGLVKDFDDVTRANGNTAGNLNHLCNHLSAETDRLGKRITCEIDGVRGHVSGKDDQLRTELRKEQDRFRAQMEGKQDTFRHQMFGEQNQVRKQMHDRHDIMRKSEQDMKREIHDLRESLSQVKDLVQALTRQLSSSPGSSSSGRSPTFHRVPIQPANGQPVLELAVPKGRPFVPQKKENQSPAGARSITPGKLGGA